MMMVTINWNMVEGQPGAENFLSPAEQERLDKMRFERRRRTFLLGRWAAKQLLQRHPDCAGLPSQAITVANHPSGDPYVLVDGRDLVGCLSISHSEEAAACALILSPEITVGIDLEVVEARAPNFVSDYFTDQEASYTRALPDDQRDMWVTCVWSAKESILKALGMGLYLDTRSVSIFPDQVTNWTDGWQSLSADGSALQGRLCRAWWRPLGQRLLTLAVLTDENLASELEKIVLQQA